jgi:hypothetical protein
MSQDLPWRRRPLLRASVAPITAVPWPSRSVTFGAWRGLARPRIGLETLQRLGPVRHALAQRAICGLVEVHAPFAPRETKK